MAPCALEDLPAVIDLVTVHPLVVVGAGRAALAFVSRLPADVLSGTTGAHTCYVLGACAVQWLL